MPGTEKFSNIETAFYPEQVTLPDGQSLLRPTVTTLSICYHNSMRRWFNQGYPHQTAALLIAPSTAHCGESAGRRVVSTFRRCHLGELHRGPALRQEGLCEQRDRLSKKHRVERLSMFRVVGERRKVL